MRIHGLERCTEIRFEAEHVAQESQSLQTHRGIRGFLS